MRLALPLFRPPQIKQPASQPLATDKILPKAQLQIGKFPLKLTDDKIRQPKHKEAERKLEGQKQVT